MVQIGSVALTPEEFHTAYPRVQAWIWKTLTAHEKDAQPITSMRFVRLPLYFDHTLLETTKFIPIDRVPMPPLSAMGLGRFAAFEQGDFDGVTYLDRYFIKRRLVTEEAIHFHELIHVIQWRVLGPFLQRMQTGWISSDTRAARLKRWHTMLRPHSSDLLRFSMQRNLSQSSWGIFEYRRTDHGFVNSHSLRSSLLRNVPRPNITCPLPRQANGASFYCCS